MPLVWLRIGVGRMIATIITNSLGFAAKAADWALSRIGSDMDRFLTMGGSEWYATGPTEWMGDVPPPSDARLIGIIAQAAHGHGLHRLLDGSELLDLADDILIGLRSNGIELR